MLILETIMGIVLLIGAGYFAFMSSHINSEIKAGKQLPLPWESKTLRHRKIFDKSEIEYRDGDNT
jgi:hypothetical protein